METINELKPANPDLNLTSIKAKIYLLALYLVAVTLVFPTKAINSYAIFFLAGAFLLQFPRSEKVAVRPRLIMIGLLSLLFLFQVIGVLYSENTATAFSILRKKLPLFVFPVILGFGPGIPKKYYTGIILAFITSCSLFAFLCTFQTISTNLGKDLPFTLANQWFYSSDNLVKDFGLYPPYFALYINLSILFLLILWHQAVFKSKTSRMLVFLLLVFLFVFEFFLAVRMATLALGLIIIGLILVWFAQKGRIGQGLLAALSFIMVISFMIYKVPILSEKFRALFNVGVHEHNQHFGNNRRLAIWSASRQIFYHNPVLGVGTGDLQDSLQFYYNKNQWTEHLQNRYNSHNLYLDILTSSGLVGFTLFLLSIFVRGKRILSERHILYGCFLVLFLLSSFPEVTLMSNKGIILFAFFDSFFFFLTPLDKKHLLPDS